MSEKVLIVTVGGSHQPVVTSVESLQPDRVIFICSDGPKGSKSMVIGPGNPCEERGPGETLRKLPNLPTQLHLGEKFQPARDLCLVSSPDDPVECYRAVAEVLRQLQESGADIHADYTGGTKTMSVGLASACMDYEIPLYLTSAQRTNLVRVERGELTELTSGGSVRVERVLHQRIPELLQVFDYPAASSELRALLQMPYIAPEKKPHVRYMHDCCVALDLWDRVNHDEAIQRFESYRRSEWVRQHTRRLGNLLGSRQLLDPEFRPASKAISGHGYECLEDLLLNADRRALQGRFDDAVGRLYRSLELFAQMRLQYAYSVRTGNVDPASIPESTRERLLTDRSPSGSLKLGLEASYTLLAAWPQGDAVGALYNKASGSIVNALQVRNHSLLAHGFVPVDHGAYRTFDAVVRSFITDGLRAVLGSDYSLPEQLPIHIPDLIQRQPSSSS